MKFVCTLLVVEDIARARAFYETVLGQTVKFDFGDNVTFAGDFAIHRKSHYRGLIGDLEVARGRNDVELYFEYDDVEAMEKRLDGQAVRFLHKTREQPWRQRVLRVYDPDGYIVEIGESLGHLCYRLSLDGIAEPEIAETVGIPEGMVREGIARYGASKQRGVEQ
ncbi:MAG TPA: VOC family protein [Spirochaetota bacterium]|nr:VOC family protein [Spirochaetota bacterium]HNT12409.1 VOC family protein [Spirochaetota bacterium]HNV46583.1 VOC family protein [Spirochaetota bacterium]HOS39415.1 VOC family protein [Spirochaetota bacterium]HPU87458.1 VOC family protein [Spirochaetota bacterium]